MQAMSAAMSAAHRPSSNHSLHNAHADIETPSWRKYAPPICDSTSLDHYLSDDDTTTEAYINRYHPLSLEERSKWAGPSSNNPSSTPNSASRPRAKMSSKRNKPFFPTPKEAFHLVRNALNAYRKRNNILPNSNHIASHQTNIWAVLESLQPTLTYFAEHEEMLRSLKTHLKAAVNALAYHQDVNEARTNHWAKPTLPDFTLLYPFSLNSLVRCEPSLPISPNPNQINGTIPHSPNRLISHPSSPPLPSCDSSLLTNDAVAMMNKYTVSMAQSFEERFRLETSTFRETLSALAHQAQICIPESASIQVICTEISRAIRSRRSTRGQKGFLPEGERDRSHKLENFIRQEIDAKKYPLLAQTFQLDKDYCLDGTRMPIESVAQRKSNGPESDQSSRKPWNSLKFEQQTPEEHIRRERKPYPDDIIGSRERQGPSEFVDRNGYGAEVAQTKKTTTFENDNDLMLAPSTFQVSRLDARRKLRQNVKRKLPRIHKERRTRKAFRCRDSAESISSGTSGASSPSPRWNSFREDAAEAMGMARRPSVTVQFQHVVDLDDKEDGTEPSVVYLDDEG